MKNKKILFAVILLILVAVLAIFTPKVIQFFKVDSCLDSGGSFNYTTKKCEYWEDNSSKNEEKKENKKEDGKLLFSHLLDDESKNLVKNSLVKAWIPEENVENFIQNVKYYNKNMNTKSFIQKGFLNKWGENYSLLDIMEHTDKGNDDFVWNNCRITSFSLMKNFIEVKNPVESDINNLAFDNIFIENEQNNFLNDEDKKYFKSFFSWILTEKTKDLQTHVKAVKDDFAKKWVKFLNKWDNSKASIISVFFHSMIEDESYLFIWHMWILVPYWDKFLFIEKLSFSEPYQAVILNNKSELNDYLMWKYDVEYNQPNARPFIFENDELMEWFHYLKK